MANVKNSKKNLQNAQTAQNPQIEQDIANVTQNSTETSITATATVLTPATKSDQLAEARVVLISCAADIRTNYIKIGEILHRIKVNNLCEKSEDFQNLIYETLDMSVPTAYRILATYEKFYLPKSLETDSAVIGALEGFKDSTLSRLLPLGDYKTIKQHIINGDFTSVMSAREVTEKVADILGKKKKPQGNGNDNGNSNGNDNGNSNGNDNGNSNGNDNGNSNGNDNGNSNGNDNGNSNGNDNGNSNGNDKDNSEKPTSYDSEVYAFVNDMISATSLVEVQNKAKAFKLRWFK